MCQWPIHEKEIIFADRMFAELVFKTHKYSNTRRTHGGGQKLNTPLICM